jgi:hypothetical protein
MFQGDNNKAFIQINWGRLEMKPSTESQRIIIIIATTTIIIVIMIGVIM